MVLNLNTLNCCHLINSRHPTPSCANPSSLTSTARIDTGTNISLLQTGAPAIRADHQTATKSVKPKGSLTTTETLQLLLNKLPSPAHMAHRSPGISNNLLAASKLADAGCELFFHITGCEVTYNGEIILRGWRDPDTRLWRVSLIPDESTNIVPHFDTISDLYESPETTQANSMYLPI